MSRQHANHGRRRHRVLVPALLITALLTTALSCCTAAAARANAATSNPLVTTPLQPNAANVTTPQELNDMCARGTSGADTLIDYEFLVRCTWLRDSLGLAQVLLVAILVVLLYLLSSTADAFFCPVLQVIVEKYRIPPDIAGVTFLSFGNGSPDVFSNIAAFSLSTPNLGVASILGGGLLVTTVIVACVGLISQGQEQLIPRKYIRDVTFYFVALGYFCFVCFDGTVHLLEALGFIFIYILYALAVLFDKKIAALAYSKLGGKQEDLDEFYDIGAGYVSSSASDKSASSLEFSSPREQNLVMKPSYEVYRIPDYKTGDNSYDSDSSSLGTAPTLFRKTSAPTPRSLRPDAQPTGERSQQQAHERQSLLERTDTYFKRPASVCVSSMKQSRQIRRRRTAWESVEASAHFGATAQRWTRSYHQLSLIEEFPSSISETEGEDVPELTIDENEDEEGGKRGAATDGELLQQIDWLGGDQRGCRFYFVYVIRKCYDVFQRVVWNPLELVMTFVRRLTIPLVDEETWDKNFAVACPPFIIVAVGVSVFHLSVNNFYFVGVILLGGGLLSVGVEYTTTHQQPPQGGRLAPFVAVAFGMSVIWIMNIADELLGVLQALGGLFGISNSVLGVSVLAWGNSIGDLVSNTSIARDGFPTMAFAGCFAGPMFNLLMGIGLALTIAVLSNGPVTLGKPSPLVYLGFGYLFASLALNLGMAAFDDFQYKKRLCYALLVLYASFAVLSIVVVLKNAEG